MPGPHLTMFENAYCYIMVRISFGKPKLARPDIVAWHWDRMAKKVLMED